MNEPDWQPIETLPEGKWILLKGQGWTAKGFVRGNGYELSDLEFTGPGKIAGRASFTGWALITDGDPQ